MEAFDQPDAATSCSRRESSTHALQALELLNGTLANDLAEAFAERLRREAGTDADAQVERAYRLAAGRPPTAREKELAVEFLEDAAACGIRPGAVQPERVPLCELMDAHTSDSQPPRVPPRRASAASAASRWRRCSRRTSAPPTRSRRSRRTSEAKARSVIFLFMAGGPSHLETFDPKPLLNKLDGQPRPAEFGEAKYQFIQKDARLLGTARKFTKHGQSGIEVSDLFPHTGEVHRRHRRHPLLPRRHGGSLGGAVRAVHRPRRAGLPEHGLVDRLRPGLGEPVAAGYVVMPDPDGALEAGQPMYTNGFLPAVYQPTMFRSGARPVRNLDLPPGVTPPERAKTVELIRELNEATLDADDEDFAARIRSYDLAFRMQTEAPEVFDLSRETRRRSTSTASAREPTDDYGRRCLLARRLVEKGVRFVVVVSGGGPGNLQWDAHNDIEENHLRMAGETDRPIAGLAHDLKRRGLLDSTLVLWGGEFGRSPRPQGGKGRDHHNLGFTMWLAGGGIKGGQVVGATDAIGLRAVEEPYHFRDIHTTILHQLGLDQDQLTYPAPRPPRAADARRGEGDQADRLTGNPLAEDVARCDLPEGIPSLRLLPADAVDSLVGPGEPLPAAGNQ